MTPMIIWRPQQLAVVVGDNVACNITDDVADVVAIAGIAAVAIADNEDDDDAILL